MPHIEFAYNRIVHATSLFSPFEVVYGCNPLTPMNILPLPTNEHANLDGLEKVYFVRELHTRVRANIERKNEQYAKQTNKGRLKVVFQPGDCVAPHSQPDLFGGSESSSGCSNITQSPYQNHLSKTHRSITLQLA